MEKSFSNKVIINGIEYTNTIYALNYRDALAIHKEAKRLSRFKFKGHLTANQ